MRVFRAERRLGTILLILVGAPLLLRPALAQTGAPVPLFPPGNTAAPSAAAPPAVLPPSQEPATSGDAEIQAEPLAPIDPSWMGTLGAADRAFPQDMWSTTSRTFVDAALPLLQPTDSPALQNLARRLLLSDAAAPHGEDVSNGPSLVERRIDRLLALGLSDGATLIDRWQQNNVSEAFDRDAVELRIAHGDLPGACHAVNDGVARYHDSWWDRALVTCQALTGAYDQATLGLSAMRDQKAARDPAFETMVDAVLGHRQKLDRLPDPSPLRMALLSAAKLPLPPDVLTDASPAALAIWATSDKVPITARLAAGEKAAAFGALPPAGLGLLYGAVETKADEQAAVLKSAKLADDPRSRAILYDVARTRDPGPSRVAALAPLLTDARRRGAFIPMARLVAPLVVEIQPAPEFQSFAGDAARVLLAAGYYDRAAPWIELAGRPELRVIAGFARASGDGNNPPPPLADAIATLTALDPVAATRQSDLLVTLATALGEPVSGIDVDALLRSSHQGTLPDGVLWFDQQQAAKANRIGETVLTTLLIASAGDHLSAEPIVLAQAITGLEAIGLDAEARAVAIEASLDAGI